MPPLFRILGLAALMIGSFVMPSSATPAIEPITTKGGLKAWLLRSDTLPMLSVDVSFRAGAAFEPKGKEGLAQFTASLLDEGAGPYDATAFKTELEAVGARFGASADGLEISVNLTTLSDQKERAFELMGLALREPRFEAEAVERIRSQLLANIKHMEEDPASMASRMLRPALFGNSPWANDGDGSTATLKALTVRDIQGWHLANLTRENMQITVVGNITAAELAPLLDDALLGLPKGAGRRGAELPAAIVGTPQTVTRTLAVPQGTVLLAWQGVPRDDPDYPALVVMNEIFGGGVLTSRLGLDVREKHGLVYDIRATNRPLLQGKQGGGFYTISLATDAAKVEKALSLVAENIAKMRDEPVTEQEFTDAQSYLIGSFPLRLDSNAKLLGMLSMMQDENLGLDYLQRWPERLAAVTHADIQRVAKRVLTPETMSLIVVGQKQALGATWPVK